MEGRKERKGEMEKEGRERKEKRGSNKDIYIYI